jgi:anti-sigma factor RsiW
VNAEVQCSQVLLLQAELDGELDAAEAAALEAHKATCPFCADAGRKLEQARRLVGGVQRFAAPAKLRDDIRRRLRSVDDSRSAGRLAKVRYALLGGTAGALAAGLLAFALLVPPGQRTVDLLVDNHLRAMQSSEHLLDVVSSEHHTVRPWFAGRVAFAPPVKDLEAAGYPLRGGRVDVLAGATAAVLVYQAGAHTIDVSVVPLASAAATRAASTVRGFNVRHWTEDGFAAWAVSDLNGAELDAFVEKWKASP